MDFNCSIQVPLIRSGSTYVQQMALITTKVFFLTTTVIDGKKIFMGIQMFLAELLPEDFQEMVGEGIFLLYTPCLRSTIPGQFKMYESIVSSQYAGLTELSWTLAAYVRTFSCMRQHVGFKDLITLQQN